MIGRRRTLPLGVDIGAARVRMALALEAVDGEVRVETVVARDTAGLEEPFLGALLEEMRLELGTRERRCVISTGVPAAALRIVKLPKMTRAERTRAARFEARQFADWDIEAIPTYVRVHPFDRVENAYAIGAAQRAPIEARRQALRDAGLRTVAVDHDACALRRALPFVDAILDIGLERSTLHAYDGSGLRSLHVPLGGAGVTRGIARDLEVDLGSAERRKRILGAAGAGVASRDETVEALARAIERGRERSTITRVALVGNGARLPGLAALLESVTGAIVETPVAEALPHDTYPQDVVRAAAPDWTLAAALATWWRAS